MSTHAVPFEKYHGTGNDFLVVDADAEVVGDRAAFARTHCDRETGVDGGISTPREMRNPPADAAPTASSFSASRSGSTPPAS